MKYLFALLLLASTCAGQSYSITPIPAWVIPQSVDLTRKINADKIDGGYYYMLIDEQGNGIKNETYYHYVYRIASEAGVQNASELSFDFNPAFQQLHLHQINVIRNGKTVSKLSRNTMKVMQREKELESHIYDNSYTAYTVMDDIRAGDVIEYSYTIIGENPIFENRFYYAFNLHSEYQLIRLYERIVKPADKTYYLHTYRHSEKPKIVRQGKTEEWIWEKDNIPPVKFEKNVPGTYRQNALVEVTEFKDWSDVKKWACGIFEGSTNPSPTVKKEAQKIKEQFPDKPEQVIAALRFCQDQIRYFGVEIGVNAIRPHKPEKTLKKRFGDCKDKSVLFCSLLRELGFKEAYPVLVNTGRCHEIRQFAPSAYAFNHCISTVVIEGQRYFFDPTSSYERGNFANTFPARYGLGLVLNADTCGLDTLPVKSLAYSYMKEAFAILNIGGETDLKVTTVYKGVEADNQRYTIANSSVETLSEQYMTYYRRQYGRIEKAEELEIEDDTVNNIYTLKEHYKINCIWDSSSRTKQNFTATFEASFITEFLNAYTDLAKKHNAPVGIRNPLHYEQDITVSLPENWNLSPFESTVGNQWLKYEMKVAILSPQKFNLHYTLQTLRDRCDPEQTADFFASISKIKNENAYTISFKNDNAAASGKDAGFHWLMLVVFVLCIVLTAGACLFLLYFTRKEPSFQFGINVQESGIGGWLVLPVIGLCIAPLTTLYSLTTGNYFDLGTWHSLTDEASSTYSIAWPFIVGFELITFAFLLVYDLFLLFMLFKKDYRFPRWMIVRYGVIIVYAIAIYIAFAVGNGSSGTDKSTGTSILMRSVFSAAIWIPYFLRSERVKNTFVK